MDSQNVSEKGSFYGKRGNQFERDLVETLNKDQNLVALKQGTLDEDNIYEFIYKLIVEKLIKNNKIKLENIVNISATNSIPKLLNNGNPKTDIALTIELSSGKSSIDTISLKATNQKVVSCHEYPAIDFIRVLDCKKTRLAEYLSLFQQFPSYKGLQNNLKEGYSINEFSQLLLKKSARLSEWALRGMHDKKNLVEPKLQISNYLLIWNNKSEKIGFYSMAKYIKLISEQKPGKLGVPFSWTYPSKRRGKRIQLKVPILFQ